MFGRVGRDEAGRDVARGIHLCWRVAGKMLHQVADEFRVDVREGWMQE